MGKGTFRWNGGTGAAGLNRPATSALSNQAKDRAAEK
jgi:hypothetical protein